MKTGIEVLDKYLSELQTKNNKVIGVYGQGSYFTKQKDEFSDIDVIVVWQSSYPSYRQRIIVAKEIGYKTHDFKDLPYVQKGLDAFEVNEIYNLGHIKSSDFFKFDKDIANLGDYYEEQLMRLEGFLSGKILYDPKGKLDKYRNKIKITPRVKKVLRSQIGEWLEEDLKLLKKATVRAGSAYYLRILTEIITYLSILTELEKGKFPGSIKWYETRKNGELVDLLNDLEKKLEKRTTSQKILTISRQLGFKPSTKIEA